MVDESTSRGSAGYVDFDPGQLEKAERRRCSGRAPSGPRPMPSRGPKESSGTGNVDSPHRLPPPVYQQPGDWGGQWLALAVEAGYASGNTTPASSQIGSVARFPGSWPGPPPESRPLTPHRVRVLAPMTSISTGTPRPSLPPGMRTADDAHRPVRPDSRTMSSASSPAPRRLDTPTSLMPGTFV